MSEFIAIVMVGIALSMDTFSLALGIGMLQNSLKKDLVLSISVGIFHFFMPLLGLEIGQEIFYHLNINFNIIIGIVLLLIALSMTKGIFKKEIKEKIIIFSISGIIVFALSVSFDSLTTGIGLLAITNNIFLATTIFAVLSFTFTLMGLTVGKYAKNKLGAYSTTLGIVILLIISITYLCK